MCKTDISQNLYLLFTLPLLGALLLDIVMAVNRVRNSAYQRKNS